MKNLPPSLFPILLFLAISGIVGCGDSAAPEEGAAQPAHQEAPATDKPEQVKPATTPSEDQVDASDRIKIEGNNVNVRANADVKGEIIGQVNKGDNFDQIGVSTFFETVGKKTDFWYQIELPDRKRGWVFGAFTDKKFSKNPRTDRLRFESASMGDYYHLNFAWPEGRGYGWKCPQYYMEPDGYCDFGYGGHHELSGYDLEVAVENSEYDELMANPKYKGKLFDVTWQVEMDNPYAGEGSMETIEMETPLILGIKLVEEE